MKNQILRTIVGAGFFSSMLMLLPQGVYAQNSGLLPDAILNIFGLLGNNGQFTARFITGRVRTGLVIAMALLILVSVVYALLAAFKYIQSQGDPGKIEEAQKAIKAIFYGIAAMLIGVVGIVLVFVFFSASRPPAELYQTCLSAPNSTGCTDCINNGRKEADAKPGSCNVCEGLYESSTGDPSTEGPGVCVDPK